MCSRLSFRLLSWLSLSVVVAGIASSTQAQSPTDPLRPGGVPAIGLRNNSRSNLYFFIYDQVSWSRLSLASRAETELPFTRVILAIPTSIASGLVEIGPPQQSAERIRQMLSGATAYYLERPYFFRELRPELRWELCWSSNQNAWVVQPVNDNLCR